jgi:Bacteriophage HK97-gp10, putative tail-component
MGADVSFSLKNMLPNITKMLPEKFEQALLKSAIEINNEVKRTLTGQRHGKLYRVAGTQRTYRASSPAEPPAVRLGHLRNSYQYKVKGNGFGARAYVGSPLDYAHYLEYGTAHMRPRRHLSVAFKKSKIKILPYFKDLLE